MAKPKMSLTKQHLSITQNTNIVCLIGLLIAAYGLFVEFHMDQDPLYKPYCDVNPQVSCSKAFLSKWGKGFGLVEPYLGKGHILNQRNPLFGVVFYTLLLFIGNFASRFFANLHLALVVLSNFGSIYLAYLLYAKIHSWCLVCISLYVVNFLLLVLSVQRRRVLGKLAQKKRE